MRYEEKQQKQLRAEKGTNGEEEMDADGEKQRRWKERERDKTEKTRSNWSAAGKEYIDVKD